MSLIETLLSMSLASSAVAGAPVVPASGLPQAAPPASKPFVLSPPPVESGPVIVEGWFDVREINRIADESELFDFTGVLILRWMDPRNAFDPAHVGVEEKVFQGTYQFDEVSPGWYPQVVLANDGGACSVGGVVQRVSPDGTSVLVTQITATAKSPMNMRRYPFDRHQLRAVFEILGFARDEVAFVANQELSERPPTRLQVPQWQIVAASNAVESASSPDHADPFVASQLVLSIDARRVPFYVMRLVVLPLVVIVMLSFSVFWMDRSSLGDRINVSFIGILTGVAYQIVMSQSLPRISYITLIHGFLTLSFVTMVATVVINLLVGSMDKRGRHATGDRIDLRCRWLFPLAYLTMLVTIGTIAATVFTGGD